MYLLTLLTLIYTEKKVSFFGVVWGRESDVCMYIKFLGYFWGVLYKYVLDYFEGVRIF
jgi:hypothetical protein